MAETALTVITTNKVRAKMAKAIAETGRIAIIKELAFGTGGVDENNEPIAPSVADNALRREVFRNLPAKARAVATAAPISSAPNF